MYNSLKYKSEENSKITFQYLNVKSARQFLIQIGHVLLIQMENWLNLTQILN